MAENWDLNAMVRSCTTTTSTNINSASETSPFENPLACLSFFTSEEEDVHPFGFPNLVVPRKSVLDELQGLYKPFIPTTTTSPLIASTSSSSRFRGSNGHQHQQQHPTTATITSPFASTSSNSFLGRIKNQEQQNTQQPQHRQQAQQLQQQQEVDQQQQQQQQQQQVNQQEVPRPGTSSAIHLQRMQPLAPRSRKRKAHLKRTVCQVTAENLSADLWAWRKYGQKPIKGSPYPRNYYRCSSCKGCAARKQVERSTTDPNIFIVTYTGDHTHPRPAHRNSLAGSTRNKSAIIPNPSSSDPEPGTPSALNPSCSSPLSATTLSPTTPLTVPTVEEVANEKSNNGECSVTDGVEEENQNNEVADDEDFELEEDELLIENTNTAMTDDIFMGLQQLIWYRDAGTAAGASSGGGC